MSFPGTEEPMASRDPSSPASGTVSADAGTSGAAPATASETPTSRLDLMLGPDGHQKLAEATVMVLGLGGVGSACAEALARGGVGNLVLVDRDVVSVSNINRQVIAYHSTVGMPKSEVAARMVHDIAPHANVRAIQRFVLADDLPELLDPEPDYIVDAQDTVSTKLALALWSQQRGTPLVSSMAAANKFHPELLRFADITKTDICPLCKIMRKECRLRGIKHLRVLFSPEAPYQVEGASDVPRGDRSMLGTMSYFPPIMGYMLAGDVICHLLGVDRTIRQPKLQTMV